MKESSNVIVLRPEVAEVFPNEEAVNNALLSLIDIANKTARPTFHRIAPKKDFPVNLPFDKGSFETTGDK